MTAEATAQPTTPVPAASEEQRPGGEEQASAASDKGREAFMAFRDYEDPTYNEEEDDDYTDDEEDESEVRNGGC
ncbi:MAG: hypothetical protein BJ554DRAFT_4917 [Olpidium bornovanus]|uniref:Uncharacterized protein n=1 Tax=Olpidium bornovanus TaxID=278681 RepID=A0A8H7ZKB7_9FUNG|nr:MAG: hypothetical protein BJ554DRAFT_4917 [Olpidium bornovanus]